MMTTLAHDHSKSMQGRNSIALSTVVVMAIGICSFLQLPVIQASHETIAAVEISATIPSEGIMLNKQDDMTWTLNLSLDAYGDRVMRNSDNSEENVEPMDATQLTENNARMYVVAGGRDEENDQLMEEEDDENDDNASNMGEEQNLTGDSNVNTKQIQASIAAARLYMKNIVFSNPDYHVVRNTCRNFHSNCALWAARGECQINPSYMQHQCAPLCQTCHLLHTSLRCPTVSHPNVETDALYHAGDLNRLFRRIVTNVDFHQQYNVTILSQPTIHNGKEQGLWLVQFDDVLDDVEAAHIIQTGHNLGFQRSTDIGKVLVDGSFDGRVSEGRTSSTAWCTESCHTDPVVQRLHDRIESITSIQQDHYEYLQLLKYEKGQWYNQHNDYIPHHVPMACGSRILTFYVYLNNVPAGGGTYFPRLNITATPRRGRAVLWPSVQDMNPNEKNINSDHEAQSVQDGVKYGMNAWIHQRNFKIPYRMSCTG